MTIDDAFTAGYCVLLAYAYCRHRWLLRARAGGASQRSNHP